MALPSRERGWQDELLEKLPPGVDLAQVEASLRLSPTERLDRMQEFLAQVEAIREENADRRPRPDRDPR